MKKRILIVEDESSIADTLCYALETEGFEALWCSTAAEGKARLDEQKIDLLILDIGLPDTNGFDFCRELRQRHSLPVLFLTARSAEVDRIVGLEIGADDYMVKPFSPRELTARVKAILRRSRAPASPETKPASASRLPFAVDEERCRIAYFGHPLTLSRYEYRLLKALIERPGRVLSRDQLMDLAWDAPESSLDRTVDAHVKSLRAKMKQAKPEFDPIQTHRGLGYSLKDEW